MDPEVWKHLPDHEDILRLILSRVSWETNLRLRSVNKAFYTTLSDPSLFTWSSMLTDTSFYTNHSNLKWVDGDIDADHLQQSYADPVCLFSTFQSLTNAVVNFELHRWCKLPPLGDLPFGNLNNFTVTGVAEGLLLLDSTMSEEIDGEDSLVDMYKRDRFLFNPLTKCFIKLRVVPKIQGNSGLVRNRLRMIMAVEKELVTVVAVEFYSQFQPELPRILIWRQGSEDWELLLKTFDPPGTTLDNTMYVEGPVTNAVFVGGELFLHLKTEKDGHAGERVFSYGSRASAIDPELIYSGYNVLVPHLHLFQHKGALKRLELAVVTGRLTTKKRTGWRCLIKLYTFDYSSRSWQQQEIIEMPRHIQKSLFKVGTFNQVVDVLGDILCIGNQYKPGAFVLYNFLGKQWTRCGSYAKELVNDGDFDHTIFLWSPKRYDSWHITPSVH